MENLILREIQTMQEFTILLELQQEIWGMTPGDATSPYMMNAVAHNGGSIIGAEIGGQLIGFCFGFVSWREEGRVFWSHMAGVSPKFRGMGIGYKLKHAQRVWALEHGFDVMCWTFDPMQRGNANFNFNMLRVVANRYYVNHYGEMSDEINAGLASDRLEVRWHLNDEQVIASIENQQSIDPVPHLNNTALITIAEDNEEFIPSMDTVFEHPTCFIEIPHSINALKLNNIDQARRWQLVVREAMQAAFQRDYIITDFIQQQNRHLYVLTRR